MITNYILETFPGRNHVLLTLIIHWPEVSHITKPKLQGRMGNVTFMPGCYILCQKVYMYGKMGDWLLKEH